MEAIPTDWIFVPIVFVLLSYVILTVFLFRQFVYICVVNTQYAFNGHLREPYSEPLLVLLVRSTPALSIYLTNRTTVTFGVRMRDI